MISDGPISGGTIDSIGPEASNPVKGPFLLNIDCNCCRSTSCPICVVTICIIGCVVPAFPGATSLGPVSGVAIDIKNGVITIASGTTGADGCVTLNVVSNPGTYHFTATKSGWITITDGFVPIGCCVGTTHCMDLDGKICDSNCGPVPRTVTITESGFPTAGTGTLTANGFRCNGTQTNWLGNVHFGPPAPFGLERRYSIKTIGGFVITPAPLSDYCPTSVCGLIVQSFSCDPLMITLKPPPNPQYSEDGCNCIFRDLPGTADVTITITE